MNLKTTWHAARSGLAAAALAMTAFAGLSTAAGAAAYPPMTAPECYFLAEVNADRAANGLPPLAANGVLAGLARQRSEQMLTTGVFSHYDARGGLVFTSMLDAVGFPYAFAGENLAENSYNWGQSLEFARTQLMNSPPHRANILNPRFNEAGIGIAGPGPRGEFYYTQIFAQVQ
jgi:uncharacterized protein YkwD